MGQTNLLAPAFGINGENLLAFEEDGKEFEGGAKSRTSFLNLCDKQGPTCPANRP
jgi:hypothetical protein